VTAAHDPSRCAARTPLERGVYNPSEGSQRFSNWFLQSRHEAIHARGSFKSNNVWEKT